MKQIKPNEPETRSADVVAENIDRLKALFPEACSEGKVDFEVLKQLLGGVLADSPEKYGLTWHGKRMARQLALTPSRGTLRPCREESVDWDKTQNLMIEGDNLEVLKLLQKSYSGQVKLIYIDPPYNTGNDFVYPDDFKESLKNYFSVTGQSTADGAPISTNKEASGRFHTQWLNMMYPRLKLAKGLLHPDGAIFVTIADHEIHNLRAIMHEVFGEENFVATAIWQKVYSPKNSARHFSEDHDYIVIFARNAHRWTPHLLPRTPEMEARYENPDNDPRGPWKAGDLSARNFYGEGTYPITCPSGRVIAGPPSGSYWRVSKLRLEEMDKDGRIWWGQGGSNVPAIKRFLSEVQAGRVPQTLWFYEDVGHTQEAKKELIAALEFPNSDTVFETPKPTRLIQRMLHLTTVPDEGAIILDFFAGSGTTMCSVFQQNAEDGGNRRCVLVQLPEPLSAANAGMKTIADVTKERLRRTGARVRAEKPLFAGDLGFRVFKLDSSNIRTWDPTHQSLDKTLFANVDHIAAGRSESDILCELLLKLGLDLCVPITTREIAGKQVSSIGAGTLVTCLDKRISREDTEPLALGIASWHKELSPAGECTIVFRDSAFVDDVAKSNLAAILHQHGLTNVRSL